MSSEPNPSAPFDEPRRRTITLDPSRGPGLVSALDFGDPSRPIDVVFFHANGFNALTYRSVLGPLSKQLRILAVDQRGHGQTTLTAKVEGRRSWDDHRYDDIAVLDALAKEPGFKPVVLSGHSMGSTVALYAAEARPALVRSVVMFDPVIMDKRTQFIGSLPWVGPDHWAKSPLAQGALRRRSVFDDRAAVLAAYTGRGAFKTWPAESLADYVEGGFVDRSDGKVELACAPAWEASNFSAMANRPWPILAKVQRPVRIFQAEHGSTCRVGPHEDFVKTNRRGVLNISTVPGTTHFLPLERPDLVRQALAEAAA
jgi:pimeloyl-ACP methyl ester carboxylesterase